MAGILDYYGYDNNENELISIKKQLLDKQAEVDEKQDEVIQEIIDHDISGGTDLILVTYDELVELRDNSKLSKGTWYRITDYITTTTQENTRSLGYAFDIICLALDRSTLSENAFAMRHDGDTYFSASTLTSWKVKYSIDNDSDRFAWADTTNGKGVIYQLIDENDNKFPYDFYNIELYTHEDWFKSINCPLYAYNITVDKNVDIENRLSLPFVVINNYKPDVNSNKTSNIYVGLNCSDIIIESNSYNITIGYGCSGVSITNDSNIEIGQHNQNVTLSGGSSSIKIGEYNQNVTLNVGNYLIDIGDDNENITIGSGSESINIGYENNNIEIASGNNSINIGDYNTEITIDDGGNNSINIGNNNENITMDGGNDSIDIGNKNNSIEIGSGNDSIDIGNDNNSIEIGSGNDSINVGDFNENVTIDNGNHLIDIGDYNTEIKMDDGNGSVCIGNENENITMSGSSTSVLIRDYNKFITFSGDSFVDVVMGYDVCGTDVDNPLVISDSNITVMKNSQGEVKMFNLGDLAPA